LREWNGVLYDTREATLWSDNSGEGKKLTLSKRYMKIKQKDARRARNRVALRSTVPELEQEISVMESLFYGNLQVWYM